MISIFRKLWPELKVYRKKLIWILITGALVSGLKSLSPEILRRLQVAWEAGHPSLVWQLPLLLAGSWVLSGAFRYIHLFWIMYVSELVAVNLRRRLMNKYLGLNLSFFQNFERGSGGLMSRMLNDIGVIQGGIHKVADILREPFMAAFAFVYLVFIDWKLTIFIFVAFPMVIGVLRNFAKSLRKYGHLNQESMEDLTKILKECLDGTRIVQSFNLQDEMCRRFEMQANDYLNSKKKIISREEAASPISESLVSLVIAGILIYFGNKIVGGKLSFGDFVGFFAAIGLLLDSTRKIQAGYIKIQQAGVALERLEEILNSQSMLPEPSVPKAFPQNWNSINFETVSFAYGDKTVLNNVSFSVRRGEMIALVGSSGGGKSTLANLLERFFDPTSGRITIGDVALTDMRLSELRKHISLVSQDVFLFSDAIETNIHAGDFSKPHDRIEVAARLANAHDFILRTKDGYKSRVGDLGNLLSGGEKQRLSIARAILKDAPILILDEATSALDSESELEVQKGLDRLLAGRTSLVIAHRLSTIAKADRILVLKNGSVVEQGSHAELLELRGEYYKFHQLQH